MLIGDRVIFHSTGDSELDCKLGVIVGEYGSHWIVLLSALENE